VDAFEQVVSEILWLRGFWVRTSVKVSLTAKEKAKIGRRTAPRWELDIVAYSGRENALRVVECKSYMDSVGVRKLGFEGGSLDHQTRYKLFNDKLLRSVVLNRLRIQLAESGACRPNARVQLCLAAGKVREPDRKWIRDHFKAKKWELWDELWLRAQLVEMSKQGYENQVSAVVAKLLLRGNA
jgi:hypothetical protein